MLLLDTDVCVDVLRGVPDVVDEVASLEMTGRLAISALTVHELWEGMYGSAALSKRAAELERFLTTFDIVAYDEEAARIGGRLAGDLARAGKPIGDVDTMIAATAVHVGATIVTRNLRHFKHVPGLKLHAIG